MSMRPPKTQLCDIISVKTNGPKLQPTIRRYTEELQMFTQLSVKATLLNIKGMYVEKQMLSLFWQLENK